MRNVFDSMAGQREPMYIPVDFNLVMEGLKHSLQVSGNWDEVTKLIVELDLMCQDWSITEKLIAHFKALEIEMMEEEQCGPVEPNKIM